jgi:hypothetical protein
VAESYTDKEPANPVNSALLPESYQREPSTKLGAPADLGLELRTSVLFVHDRLKSIASSSVALRR